MTDTVFPASLSPAEGFLARAWWMLLLRGVLAVLFAVAAFAWPGLSLLSLIWLYGAYALIDGGAALGVAFRGGPVTGRLWLLLAAVISIGAGVTAFLWPGLTGVVLVIIIGVWSIMRGAAEIAWGFMLRKQIPNAWVLMLAGAISVLFGAALIAAPGAGALALIWLIATWALVFGLVMIYWAFRLKRATN